MKGNKSKETDDQLQSYRQSLTLLASQFIRTTIASKSSFDLNRSFHSRGETSIDLPTRPSHNKPVIKEKPSLAYLRNTLGKI